MTCVDSFNLVSCFSRGLSRGGGVAILAKSTVASDTLDLKEISALSSEKDFECCAAVWKGSSINRSTVIVLSIYRSPDGDYSIFFNKLELVLEKLAKIGDVNTQIILGGDFNIDMSEHSKSPELANLLDLTASYNLYPTFDKPTRSTNTTHTVIDNIFTSIALTDITTDSLNLHLSDHRGQLIKFRDNRLTPTKTTAKATRRTFLSHQIKHFQQLLDSTSWHDVYATETSESKLHSFLNDFMTSFNSAFPKKHSVIKQRKTAGWITPQIINASRELKELFTDYKQSGNEGDKRKYNECKKILAKDIRCAKREHNEKIIMNSHNKYAGAWTVINGSIKPKAAKHQVSLTLDSVIYDDQRDCANILNNYFCDIVPNLLRESGVQQQPLADTSGAHSSKQMFLFPVDAAEVWSILNTKCIKYSSGVDEVPSILLKQCASQICQPLADIINASFNEGKFPSSLKMSKVIPIFKKGDRSQPGNYRPIALPSAFSKVFEVALSRRLIKFLNDNQLLSLNQYGFQSGKSTIQAIDHFLNALYEALDSKRPVLGLFYDMSKAFDCMNHRVLANTLRKMGINGVVLDWILSFLSDRTQCVELTNANNYKIKSEERTTNIGVPQGTVLGPLLYIVYVNNLSKALGPGTIAIYADDTSHLITANSLDSLSTVANIAVNNMQQFCNSTGLIINSSKTTFINFHTAQRTKDRSLLIKMKKRSLVEVAETKFLGISISSTLEWHSQIRLLVKKLSAVPYLIRNLRKMVSQETVLTTYYGIVQSRLTYGIIFWGWSAGISRILLLQKRIIRSIAGASFRTTCRPLFRSFKILTIPALYIYQSILYAIANKHAHPTNSSIHNHDTRIRSNFHIFHHNLTIFKKNPSYSSIILYNSLPVSMKFKIDNSSLNTRKIILKTFLVDMCPYSIKEYFNFVLTL